MGCSSSGRIHLHLGKPGVRTPWRACTGAARRTRLASVAMADAATALADLVLRDHADRAVRLGDLWAERPVALAWLRHYG